MNEIAKNLMCICLRNGVEIWIEKDRIEKLFINLEKKEKGFFNIDEELLNIADIVGIFTPQTMEELIRRKNGEWKCNYNYWHQKGKQCDCIPTDEQGRKFLKGTGWV